MTDSQLRIKNLILRSLEQLLQPSGGSAQELTDDVDILRSGIIDSLAFIDLLLRVEAELDVSLALDQIDFERISSLKDLVAMLDRLTVAK